MSRPVSDVAASSDIKSWPVRLRASLTAVFRAAASFSPRDFFAFWAITAFVLGVIYFAGTATALILIWRAAQ